MSRGAVKWLVVFSCCLFSLMANARDKDRLWAREAESLHLDKHNDWLGKWTSPDGSASLLFKEGPTYLRIGAFRGNVNDIVGAPWLLEVGWSQEAHGLFVNASEGGGNGSWGSRVFVTRNGKVVEVPVRRLVIATKRLVAKCHPEEDEPCDSLDLGSLAWLDHGRKILVMLAVPNSSYYTNMDEAMLFVIDVQNDAVDKILSPAEALRSYSTYMLPWIRKSLADSSNEGQEKHSHD